MTPTHPITHIDILRYWIAKRTQHAVEQQADVLDLNDLDVSRLTDLSHAFLNLDRSIQTLKVDQWDVSQVESFEGTFEKCRAQVDVSRWNVSRGKTFADMFSKSIQHQLDLNQWDVSSGTDFCNMFLRFKGNVRCESWNLSSAIDLIYMFYEAQGLVLNISKWNPIHAVDLNGFMAHQKNITGLSRWGRLQPRSMAFFAYNSSLNESLPWDFSNVKDASHAFCQTPFAQSLLDWDFPELPLTRTENMFEYSGWSKRLKQENPSVQEIQMHERKKHLEKHLKSIETPQKTSKTRL